MISQNHGHHDSVPLLGNTYKDQQIKQVQAAFCLQIGPSPAELKQRFKTKAGLRRHYTVAKGRQTGLVILCLVKRQPLVKWHFGSRVP